MLNVLENWCWFYGKIWIKSILSPQSNEVQNSYNMEKEGLKRGLNNLYAEQLQIKEIVTDRHVQVRKYLKTERPEIKHSFDVWHIAKGKGIAVSF